MTTTVFLCHRLVAVQRFFFIPIDVVVVFHDVHLILCFLRHRHPDCAWCTPAAPADERVRILEEALSNHKHQILGVGLDSSEVDNPPEIFKVTDDQLAVLAAERDRDDGQRPFGYLGHDRAGGR